MQPLSFIARSFILESAMADLLPNNESSDDTVRPGAGVQGVASTSGLSTDQTGGDDIVAAPRRVSVSDDEKQLFPPELCSALGDEWQSIQAGFVDSPRVSVQNADALVKKTIGVLERSFADIRNSLERDWEKDKEVSTEDLRVALQNYRSFFQRLLSV